MRPPTDPGLCASCRHSRMIRNDRGSEFWLCRQAAVDARLPKYPRLPVLRCPAYEPAPPSEAPMPS